MENIDITSKEFSLENISNSTILESKSLEFTKNDEFMYIYIAIGIIIFIIILFIIYKFDLNKTKHVSFNDKNEEYYIPKY